MAGHDRRDRVDAQGADQDDEVHSAVGLLPADELCCAVLYDIQSQRVHLQLPLFPPQAQVLATRAFWHVYKNHWMFGAVILDRFASYSGKRFKIEVPQMYMYSKICSRKEGFVQLSAHIGNDEMAGYELKPPKKMNALVFGGEGETLTENRARVLEKNNVRLVNISEDMSHLVILNNALADGEIVNILGDRVFGSNRTIRCEILNGKADLPLGPFLLAAMRDVPVISVFVVKTGLRRYTVNLFRPDEWLSKGLDVREKAEEMAMSYAFSIKMMLLLYPDQWFNFYEFWND